MISDNLKCIYIHIPKTAGTSVIKTLNIDSNTKNINARSTIPFKPEDDKFNPPPPHLRAIDYINLDKEKFDRYFKFAFVRNPWDRIVSEYKYRRHAGRYCFKEFVFNHLPAPTWSDEYCHIIPQYDFLYDNDHKLLIDYVGKFENIDNDFRDICDKLKISPIRLAHKNKSLSLFRRENSLYQVLRTIRDSISIKQKKNTFKHYTEYYDSETVKYVEALYLNDIKAFNYHFDE